MTGPWDLTAAQRRQFREAHAEAKRTRPPSKPVPAEGQTATCRKCHLVITMLGGDWTCTEGDMYGLTNCGADLSAPYTPHEPEEG